jgi:NADPH-dependent 2,4-dienoyl-CoA reductase/sulfur reductase-like enzyme
LTVCNACWQAKLIKRHVSGIRQVMPLEKTNTLVVGGGQAGLAMSAHLRRAGVDHIVLAHDASLIVAQVKRAY